MRSSALFVGAALALGLAACDKGSNPTSTEDLTSAEVSRGAHGVVYRVTHLASLGGTASSGNAMNNRGWVAGSSNLPDGSAHAALWRGESLEDLGTLGGPNSNVAWPGLNNSGSMVVGIAETAEPGGETWACQFFFPSSTGNQCLGFVWEDGVMTPLPTWGGTNGFATGVNSRGQVVGWAENLVEDPTCNAPVRFQFRAALWEPRTDEMRELRPLPGDSTSAATAINDSGYAVGISGRCANAVGGFSAQHAVLWAPDGTPTQLADLGGEAWHTPMDINNAGDVVGFGNPADVPGDAFAMHAFFLPKGGPIEELEPLPGDAISQALGINGRGQVVGLSSGPNGNRAFLFEDGVMKDLNTLVTPDYTGRLLYAGYINDAGVITGQAVDPATSDTVAFVATPIGSGTTS